MGPAVSVLDSLSMLLVLIFWILVAFLSHRFPNVSHQIGTGSFSKNPSSKFRLASSDNVGSLYAHKLNWLPFQSPIPTI